LRRPPCCPPLPFQRLRRCSLWQLRPSHHGPSARTRLGRHGSRA
jgi:hypothetical protein